MRVANSSSMDNYVRLTVELNTDLSVSMTVGEQTSTSITIRMNPDGAAFLAHQLLDAANRAIGTDSKSTYVVAVKRRSW